MSSLLNLANLECRTFLAQSLLPPGSLPDPEPGRGALFSRCKLGLIWSISGLSTVAPAYLSCPAKWHTAVHMTLEQLAYSLWKLVWGYKTPFSKYESVLSRPIAASDHRGAVIGGGRATIVARSLHFGSSDFQGI